MIVQFVVICLLCALALLALRQFPTLDGTIVRFISIAIYILLSILLINLILALLFGTSLGVVLRRY